MNRNASVKRKTKETDIALSINLDGAGKSEISTGIGFFDHMLEGFSRHGFFDLDVKVTGDLHVDGHHTVEDTGIVLGTAIKEALGDKKSIKRFGSCILPMDDALCLCAVDLGGIAPFVKRNSKQRSKSEYSSFVMMSPPRFSPFLLTVRIPSSTVHPFVGGTFLPTEVHPSRFVPLKSNTHPCFSSFGVSVLRDCALSAHAQKTENNKNTIRFIIK